MSAPPSFRRSFSNRRYRFIGFVGPAVLVEPEVESQPREHLEASARVRCHHRARYRARRVRRAIASSARPYGLVSQQCGRAAGLYGFSAVLTSIALSAVFYTPSPRVAIYTIIGIVFTVIAQGALNVLVRPFGIPTLTAPFVFVTWLFLLPKARLIPVMHQPIESGAARGSAPLPPAGAVAHLVGLPLP